MIKTSLLAASLVSLAIAPVVRAQCEGQWLRGGSYTGVSGATVPDASGNPIYPVPSRVASWDPDGPGPLPPQTVIAGSFSAAGVANAANIALFDGEQFLPMGSGLTPFGANQLLGPVRSMADHAGSLFVLGSFSSAGGVPVQGCARWDGTWHAVPPPLGSTASPAAPGEGVVLSSHDGELVAGGAAGFVRWDGAQWQVLAGPLAGARVNAVTMYNGEPIMAGQFAALNGQTYNHIVRWDGSAWQSLGGGVSDQGQYPPAQVNSMDHYKGNLIVSGSFVAAGGATATNVARWNGQAWSGMGYTTGSLVAVVGGSLYQSAAVSRSAGICGFVDEGSVNRWTGSGWQSLSAFCPGRVRGMAACGDRLVVVGDFYGLGGVPSQGMAAFDGQAWSLVPSAIVSEVQAFATRAGATIIGRGVQCKKFDSARVLNSPLSWSGDSAIPVGAAGFGSNIRCDSYTECRAFAEHTGSLYAAGYFTYAGANFSPMTLVARFDGTTWQPLSSTLSTTSTLPVIHALRSYNGSLIVGGDFAAGLGGGSAASANIRRWDGASWQPFGSGANGAVRALAEFQGELIAAGEFTTIDGVPANRVARWDGSAWRALGGGIGPTGSVKALVIYNGALIAVGQFSTADGFGPVFGVASWNGVNWSPVGNPPQDANANAAVVYRGDLVVGGNALMRWNGSTWRHLDPDWGPPFASTATVNALLVDHDELLIGTSAGTLGASPSRYFHRWTDTNTPWIAGHPVAVPLACINSTVTLRTTPAAGYSGLSFTWRRNGQLLADGPTPHASIIAGAQTPTLQIANIAGADAGSYDCVVSNACGSAATAPASIGLCPADTDCNGIVEPRDIGAFINLWITSLNQGSLDGDFDRNGTVEAADIGVFISSWLAAVNTGC
ncbi:MAG: immunoglobulin domain-containing protein [Phycisphaeraceae bacterium]|nr:immunoglobulin domain-containing protein [Phycisphaeraceae bacterium]